MSNDDRMTWCDRCGQCANGSVEWWNVEGWLRLKMCDHHSREHADVLFDRAWACHINSDVWGVDPRPVSS